MWPWSDLFLCLRGKTLFVCIFHFCSFLIIVFSLKGAFKCNPTTSLDLIQAPRTKKQPYPLTYWNKHSHPQHTDNGHISQSAPTAVKDRQFYIYVHVGREKWVQVRSLFIELSHLSQQMAMKGTSAGTSADLLLSVCVGGCMCVWERCTCTFFKCIYVIYQEISLIRATSGSGVKSRRERVERQRGRGRERERVTVSQMKKDSIRNRVLIVSKQGRCVGPGEEDVGVVWDQVRQHSHGG